MKHKRGVVLPDIHVPRHHEPSVKAALKFTKDYKPDILIQLGDFCDLDSISRFDPRRKRDLIGLTEELDSVPPMLDRIESALPRGCRKMMLEGNHDHRLETFDLTKLNVEAKKLIGRDSLGDWVEEYELDKRGWEHRPYGVVLGVGRASFVHGKYINKYHAFKNITKHFRTIFYGHTHTWQVHCVVGVDGLPVAGVSLGTLSRFDLSYLDGERPDWVHMFMFIDFFPDGRFTPHIIPIINGKFIANGKEYDGNT